MTLAIQTLSGRTIARSNPTLPSAWVVDELSWEFNVDERDVDFDEAHEVWMIQGEPVARLIDESHRREMEHYFPRSAA